MTKRILFYIDLFTLHFGLANYVQKNTDYELFGLIDTTNKPKNFFQNQKLVKFKNQWFYHDFIDIHKVPDFEYLKKLSNIYGLDVKKLIKNDRHFNHYNKFFTFTENQKKSIFAQECKLYEKIISESNVDYLIITQPSLRHSYVLYKICKSLKVTPLVINPSVLGYQTFVSSHINKLDSFNTKNITVEKKSFNELQNILKQFNVNTQIVNYIEKFGQSKLSLVKSAYKFLFINDSSNTKTHYTYFGRSKVKVLSYSIKNLIQKRSRMDFINKNFQKSIKDEKIIYFPLQVEPDRNLLLGAPDFVDQLNSVVQIAKRLPPGYKLYVKEHPGQNRTWREISYYEKMLKLKNVKLIHPHFPSEKIYQKCDLVITAVGTSGFEALFYGIPVIIFGDTIYSDISTVTKMNSFDKLESIIINSLNQKPNPDELNLLLKLLERNSIDFDLFGYYTLQAHEFYHDSNLIDVEISEEKMKNFLESNNDIFCLLGNHIIDKTKI